MNSAATTWGVSDSFAESVTDHLTREAAFELAQSEANKTGFRHLAICRATGAVIPFEPKTC